MSSHVNAPHFSIRTHAHAVWYVETSPWGWLIAPGVTSHVRVRVWLDAEARPLVEGEIVLRRRDVQGRVTWDREHVDPALLVDMSTIELRFALVLALLDAARCAASRFVSSQ